MRRRMIDPAFWNDSKIIAMSLNARLFYIGLWSYADDEGFFLDDLAAIKRTLFPDQEFDIHGAFSECSCFLKRHQYKDPEHFAWEIAHFLDWQKINRPTKSKIKPFCTLTESSLSPHGALTPKLREVKLIKEEDTDEFRATPGPPKNEKPEKPKEPWRPVTDRLYLSDPEAFQRIMVFVNAAAKQGYPPKVIADGLEGLEDAINKGLVEGEWWAYAVECVKKAGARSTERAREQDWQNRKTDEKRFIANLVGGVARAKGK